VASESTPPPPQGGGARYAIIGVALAAAALLAYCLLQPPAPTTPLQAGPADAGVIERSTALVEDDMFIPDPEPDAGPLPDAWSAPEPTTHHTTHVAAGSWDCTGEIDSAAIRRVFEQYNPQIRNCYERGLKGNPMLQGSMTLQIKVGASGSVEGTQVGGSLRDRDVFSCVRQISQRMQFPRVSGGACAVVQVPYSFTPQQ
jgi:hypothetical protein